MTTTTFLSAACEIQLLWEIREIEERHWRNVRVLGIISDLLRLPPNIRAKKTCYCPKLTTRVLVGGKTEYNFYFFQDYSRWLRKYFTINLNWTSMYISHSVQRDNEQIVITHTHMYLNWNLKSSKKTLYHRSRNTGKC